MNERELYLNETMYNYGKLIYQHLFDLCELEKAGKKDEKSYSLVMQNLRDTMNKEDRFYREHIDEIYKGRGFISLLITKKGSKKNNEVIHYLADFIDDAVNERIRTKLKQYIGIEKILHYEKYHNKRLNYCECKNISNAFLEDMLLSDVQRVSMYYMEKEHQDFDEERFVDYKYLTSLIFNMEQEFVNNWFIPVPDIYIRSSLIYCMEGYYKESYIMDLNEILSKKFKDIITLITSIECSLDEDKYYKIAIALSHLQSILDLLPEDIEIDFRNEQLVDISNNHSIPDELKETIMEAIYNSGKARSRIKFVTLGSYEDWH